MKIIGIDPAIGSLGWGVIEQIGSKINYIDSGLVKTIPSSKMQDRLAYIAHSIEELIDLHKPDAIAMEETFVNINALSSMKLAYARGAIMAVIGKSKIPFYEYKPNQIKKTITGAGHAEKDQIKYMVNIIISGNTENLSSDEADAIAIAYTCLVSYSMLS